MSKVIVLKQNSPEIRLKIKDAGISVCICCEFLKSVWLDCYPEGKCTFDVHGIGYSDEDWTVEHELAFVEHDWKQHNTDEMYRHLRGETEFCKGYKFKYIQI